MMSEQADTETVFERRESEVRSYCRAFGAVFASARGAEIFDVDGTRRIDFLAGCASLNYGHNDPDMKAALIDHIASNGIAHGLDMHTRAKGAFLDVFEQYILRPRGLDYKVMFPGPTGANAVEAALKIARKATGRSNVIAFTNGFHGVTLGALAATGNGYHRGGAHIALSGVTRLPYDDYLEGLDSTALLQRMLEDASSGLDAPAAILLETVQGEGGLNAARPEWLRRVAELARVHGALLIIDDVQAGCGRCGSFFSFEEAGIVPDMVTMAKSISGFGLPMSLVLVNREHDVLRPAEHNGTFRGNTHAFVTARVAIEKFWSDAGFESRIREAGNIVAARLAASRDVIGRGRLKGRGMMRGLDVGSGARAARICKTAWHDGLIIETSGPDDEVVKVLAPLTTPIPVLEEGLAILDAAIRAEVETAPLIAAE